MTTFLNNVLSVQRLNFLFQVALYMHPLEYLVDTISALVSYGCYIHTDAVLPLHYAIQQNSPSIVAALLSARLKFSDTVRQALATEDRGTGFLPLHMALSCGYFECAQELIDAGADVNATCRCDTLNGVTALELAVRTDNKDAVQLLVQSPNCQIDKVGTRKFTALLHATVQGLTTMSYFCIVLDVDLQ